MNFKKVLLVISAGTDIFLFLLSVMPNCYELIWENPFAGSEVRSGDNALFVMFTVGAVFYSYAVLTAMVQNYDGSRLKELRQFRLRRLILFVIAYLSFLSVLVNAQSVTGLFPEDMPVRPEAGGAMQWFLLCSGAATLYLSTKYYKFLGRMRDRESGN